jgi:hypothetical protein
MKDFEKNTTMNKKQKIESPGANRFQLFEHLSKSIICMCQNLSILLIINLKN